MSTKEDSKSSETTKMPAATATTDAEAAKLQQQQQQQQAPTTSNSNNNNKAAATRNNNQKILDATLWEFTAGIPRRELKLMISESTECETLLRQEIKLLEDAWQEAQQQQNDKDDEATTSLDPKVQALLDSPFTPMDQYWTLSALLGRLRGELSPPTLVSVQAGQPSPPLPNGTTYATARGLLEMRQYPSYRREHTSPHVTLLPTWKKICAHRLAAVFKKPVRDEDAPGYSARIRFPMDLSTVRKLVLSRHVKSLADLHIYIGLITHNCVKYNGRETDYGIVAREFEQFVDDVIRHAVLAAEGGGVKAAPSAPLATAVPSGATASSVAGEEKQNNN